MRRPDGTKLSKANGDTGIRELRDAGLTPSDVIARVASTAGLGSWSDRSPEAP